MLDTKVNLAFSWNSGIEIEPQLHIVDFIFATVIAKLSFKDPAYGIYESTPSSMITYFSCFT